MAVRCRRSRRTAAHCVYCRIHLVAIKRGALRAPREGVKVGKGLSHDG